MNSLNWSDFEVEKNEQLVKCDLGITPLSMNSISYSDFEHSANELNETTNRSSKLQLNSPSCPEIIHTPHSKDTEQSSVYSYVLCQDAATSPWAGTQSEVSSVCTLDSSKSLVERTSHENTTSAVRSHFDLFRIIKTVISC